ncbi:uncharacterized protein LOC106667730 [Cimex lectularius]|uniref:Uncharacterized protein n=1 Tax=Cimex lectularius TaxID=79782 RepID=A0A8I6RRT8_CIMLE|nr:uncharacterized protein LOC106667730 [Cimex lectularius]
MLKFLTHKLKTHSLNEDDPQKVEDDDHDSGTESDDEHGTSDEPEISMESEGGSVVTALSRSRSSLLTPASPYFLDSALPSDCDQGYDQHSSEEELEVINCKQAKSHTGQEKRKWSQVTPENVGVRRPGRCRTEGGSSGSSDEEVVGLVAAMTAPVQFRTSPPRGTHRPYSAALHEASPRKRHRNAAPPRPCLDFEKMQQLQAKGMTTWRHTGDSGGELSVYCW